MGRILTFLIAKYGQDLDNKKIREALAFSKNKGLAGIGDSVLDLVIREKEYLTPGSNPKSMDALRQSKAKRKKNQGILEQDKQLTEYLLEHDYSQNPQGKIGLDRSDQYMEAIIGAIYLSYGLSDSQKFIEEIYSL